LKTTEPASKIKFSSSRTETIEILKSYSHFKIAFILYLFLFHIGYIIYACIMCSSKQQYLTSDIELIIKYRMIWIPSVLTVFSLRGKSSAVIFYCLNKTQFVSFFVYTRQSWDCFRIVVNVVSL